MSNCLIPEPATHEASEPCVPAPQTPPLLVVDDDELVLDALRETLFQAHYEVVATSVPRLALEELRQREFSVVISDQRMPEISGLELLAQARQLRPNAVRVLITGVLNLDLVVEAINQGEIFRFIVKPWLREEFLATVRNSVQRYELLCQNARLQATTLAMNRQLADLNRTLERQIELVARQNQQLSQMNQMLDENFQRSLELSVHLLQTFHPSLGSQAQQAFRLSQSIAEVLQLVPEQRRILESSALLHDIGLVGVPRRLIRRWQENPAALDLTEESLIRRHPVLGQEMVGFGRGLSQVGEVIRAHHERFDGVGYPDGLQGESISWLARLLAVVVGYVSSSASARDRLNTVKAAAGSAFDPEAVRALAQALPLVPAPRAEKEIALTDLRPGMVLACGVYTSNGQLLLPEGQRLNPNAIERIRNQDRIKPITRSLVVYG